MAALVFHLDSVEQEDPWPVALKLFGIVEAYVQPGSTASASDTAEKLHALRPDVRPSGDPDAAGTESVVEFMGSFWTLFAEMACEMPHGHPSQERLVQLAFALRKFAEDKESAWEWRGTNGSLHEMLHMHDFDPHSSDPANLVQKARTRNLHAFVARLTEARYEDYAYAALFALRPALEQVPDPRSRAWRTLGPVLDAWIPVAEVWIRLVGGILLRKCRDEVEVAGPPFPDKKNGRRAFFPERWQHWKDTLAEVGGMEQPSEQTKEVAERARAKMLMLEQGDSADAKE